MPGKPGFARREQASLTAELGQAVADHLKVKEISSVYPEANGKGLFLRINADGQDRRLLLSELTGTAPKNPEGDDPLSVRNLNAYMYDPDADVEPPRPIWEGFISWGDLVVWFGREKHRKSNLILQAAICAAIGRDFLGFKFVAGEPLHILLIDFESKSSSLKQRCDAIVDALDLSENEKAVLYTHLRILEVRRIRKGGRLFPKFPHRTGLNSNGQVELTKFWEDLVARNPADLYIIDPLRMLHGGDENDSGIETLLSEIQRIFRGAAVIAAHHMRKQGDHEGALVEGMRSFSEGGRGSSAIKCHADVVVLQERSLDKAGNEVVHLGAFQKDGADIEPIPLMESDHNSFYWEPVRVVPAGLMETHKALVDGGGRYLNKSKAALQIMKITSASRATAHRHIDAMLRQQLLVLESGGLVVPKLAS